MPDRTFPENAFRHFMLTVVREEGLSENASDVGRRKARFVLYRYLGGNTGKRCQAFPQTQVLNSSTRAQGSERPGLNSSLSACA